MLDQEAHPVNFFTLSLMYPNLSYRKKEQGKVPNQASLDTNLTNYLLHDFKGCRVVQFLPSIPVSTADWVHVVNVKGRG